jgi:hypothetical protein
LMNLRRSFFSSLRTAWGVAITRFGLVCYVLVCHPMLKFWNHYAFCEVIISAVGEGSRFACLMCLNCVSLNSSECSACCLRYFLHVKVRGTYSFWADGVFWETCSKTGSR